MSVYEAYRQTFNSDKTLKLKQFEHLLKNILRIYR